jgi:hypothetical protein
MDQDIPNQATLNARRAAFVRFWKNEIANPPKVVELFKTPDGLSPAWQVFFDKVTAYHERQCAGKYHILMQLEKRSWIMESETLCEFEMLASAQNMKNRASGFGWTS